MRILAPAFFLPLPGRDALRCSPHSHSFFYKAIPTSVIDFGSEESGMRFCEKYSSQAWPGPSPVSVVRRWMITTSLGISAGRGEPASCLGPTYTSQYQVGAAEDRIWRKKAGMVSSTLPRTKWIFSFRITRPHKALLSTRSQGCVPRTGSQWSLEQYFSGLLA